MSGLDYIETSDIGLAASLTASGFVIARVDKQNPNRAVFVFEPSPDIEKYVKQFYANTLLLPATTLLSNIRQLKTRIYS